MRLTLEEFRASVRVVTKDKDWCDDNMPGRDTCEVLEYTMGCWIARVEEPNFYLIIENRDWLSPDPEKLEEILYHQWYLHECGYVADSEGGHHD